MDEDWIAEPSECTAEFRHDLEKHIIPSLIVTNKRQKEHEVLVERHKGSRNHTAFAGTLTASHLSPVPGGNSKGRCRGDALFPAAPGEDSCIVEELRQEQAGLEMCPGTLASSKTTAPAQPEFFLQIPGP